MLKLLIAVDGSPHAQHAVEAAARLGQAADVQVVLLNVRDVPGYHGDLPPLDYDALERTLRQRQATLLEAALAHALNCGLQGATTLAAAGPTAQEIVRAAADSGADQIVMGTRGMNALGGLLLGSVAQRVVHLADRPVLLVK